MAGVILGIASAQCPRCGKLREVRIRTAFSWWRAVDRLCLSCTALVHHYDVDDMAVERLIIGSRVNATAGERQQAVAYLTRSGRSARVIAERIGCTQRTVVRHRSRLAGN